ncbi:hypothetical protein AMR72_15200 [Flavobacterium psychrophilum]|nr:hypothetical protein AMR72_15200 [Flavobacterium psychrophilum]AOE53743.1 hypothetical protein ALW18_15190 [Flavobacterium psychrophilum]
MRNNFEAVYSDVVLNSVINNLLINLFTQNVDNVKRIAIEDTSLRKAVWTASILGNSTSFIHKQKVQQLASLLHLNYPERLEIAKICYILFSRVGNLTATRFLNALFAEHSLNPEEQVSHFSEDVLLEQELTRKRQQNMLYIEGKSYLTTDFQRELWESLVHEDSISVSAPTSSGKSFILKKYIEHQFSVYDKYTVLYIVPSRALINQVSEEFRVDLNDVEIRTAFISDIERLNNKIIYVLTPERAIKIVNLNERIIEPNIIFIDEIQGVEDEQGRGNLFEYVYSELAKQFPASKIITAGPNIRNPDNLFKELFNKHGEVSQSELSPVFQLKTVVNLTDSNIDFRIYGSNHTYNTITKQPEYAKNLKKLYEDNRGVGLSVLIKEVINNPEENNIVYSSRSDYAEGWALKYAQSLPIIELPQEIKDLIEYLKEDVHPRYLLIQCLEKRVAFHHGKLSELARKEIEVLFQNGHIKTIFCTSTLLEGVNMPANNLFILKPEKNRLSLSSFEFGNLIGRAGRIKDSLYGTIFCITVDNERWAEEYYLSDYSKEVETSSTKTLREVSVSDFSKPLHEIEDSRTRNLLISLRHKYLKGELSLEEFLKKKGFSEDAILGIEQEVIAGLNTISIPYEVVKLNPTIDPVLQNELYERIKNDGTSAWVIHNSSRFFDGYRRDVAANLPYEQNSFYWQLDSLIHRLNEIFKITDELYARDRFRISESTMCQNSVNWINGRSMGELINNRINFLAYDDRVKEEYRIDPNKDSAINKVIREVININSKAITYSLLKYIKLLVDILDSMMTEEQKNNYKSTFALPTHLEMGTKDPVVIQLITSGMPRSIALKVFDSFSKTDAFKVHKMDVILWLSTKDSIEGLRPIYNKYLWRQKYLRVNKQ